MRRRLLLLPALAWRHARGADVDIHIDASGLLLTAKRFRALKDGMQRAIREGLNQGGDKVSTDVRKALWKQTGLSKYASVLRRTRTIKATDAGSGSFTYVIAATGKGIPIKEFKVSVRKGPGGGVNAAPWNVPRQFQRSFALASGGYRARLPGGRTVSYVGKDGKAHRGYALRSLYGPSIAKEAMTGAIPTVFMLSVSAQVPPIILARMARALESGP